MIPCTEFIPAYSELFKYLEGRGGKEAVLDFWRYLSDNFLHNLRDLVAALFSNIPCGVGVGNAQLARCFAFGNMEKRMTNSIPMATSPEIKWRRILVFGLAGCAIYLLSVGPVTRCAPDFEVGFGPRACEAA